MVHGFKLYTGAGIRETSEVFLAQALERYKSGECDTIFVVPTHRYALNLRLRFISIAPHNWLPPPVYSLEEFLRQFLPGAVAMKSILSEEESAALIRRIALENPEKYRSLFPNRQEPFPNAIASISRLIREMKEEGISPDRLVNIPGAQENAGIVQSLFSSYEDFLHTHHLTDRADILRIALENVSPSTVKKILPQERKSFLTGLMCSPAIHRIFESPGQSRASNNRACGI